MKRKHAKRKHQPRRKKNSAVSRLAYLILAALVIGGLYYGFGSGGKAGNPPPERIPGGFLSAVTDFHNFGRISMGGGKVSHRFTLENTGSEPALIRKLYSS